MCLEIKIGKILTLKKKDLYIFLEIKLDNVLSFKKFISVKKSKYPIAHSIMF